MKRKETTMSIDLIRQEQPVKNSIHNLIQTLSVKLDSAARYGLYQEDAREDGFDDCAELFGRLAQQDRDAIQELMGCLRDHLPAEASG
jgi:rubrerythrin